MRYELRPNVLNIVVANIRRNSVLCKPWEGIFKALGIFGGPVFFLKFHECKIQGQ